MSKNMPLEITLTEAKKFEALLDEVLAEIKRARNQMAKDQVEIDRLHASTQMKLDELKRELKVA
ncbi:MAG: hypothetical protein AB1757_08025 [Acidobacteriota bacterium]